MIRAVCAPTNYAFFGLDYRPDFIVKPEISGDSIFDLFFLIGPVFKPF